MFWGKNNEYGELGSRLMKIKFQIVSEMLDLFLPMIYGLFARMNLFGCICLIYYSK